MNSFKDIAYQILKEVGKPLHSKEITKIALQRGWLKTAGKTPEATMNAQLIVDINSKKEKSLFIKTAPSTFALRFKEVKVSDKGKGKDIIKKEKLPKISPKISTRQKGDIAEARIAELIVLYGDTTLSCYKPLSDDEGIDLIVKEKGSLKTMYIQIKSRFGSKFKTPFVTHIKVGNVIEHYSSAIVFCFFDENEGDLWDYLWFVPTPEFIKNASIVQNKKYGPLYNFVAGRSRRKSNLWDRFLIDKRDLANQIIAQMKRI